MTIDDKNIIWLDSFHFLSYQKKQKLLQLFAKGEDLVANFFSNQGVYSVLTTDEFSKIKKAYDPQAFEAQLEKFRSDNIQFVTIYDPNYPTMLKEIDTPPLCLYCRGNLQLLSSYCIGVVGSRRVTDYGVVVTKQYVKKFVDNDITVVSGMASGVDTIAHLTAIENKGKTIAVLAGGLYHIYPASNLGLSKRLAEDNLILSEVYPTIEAQAYYFPIRNRIIAGLSYAVLITEAGEKSGSLHTKDYALEYNREIFVVPGRINSPMSRGTNATIKELQGCITLDPDDVLQSLNINEKSTSTPAATQFSMEEQIVLNFIRSEKHTFQEIIDHTKFKTSDLNLILMQLTMSGSVLKLPNNSYIMA